METVKQKIYQSKAANLDTKGRVLIAVNAFGNTDSDGDISAPGSFKKTLKENFNRVRWFLNHDTTILLGVPIKGYEEIYFPSGGNGSCHKRVPVPYHPEILSKGPQGHDNSLRS